MTFPQIWNFISNLPREAYIYQLEKMTMHSIAFSIAEDSFKKLLTLTLIEPYRIAESEKLSITLNNTN
jgi:hypothetical protein